jgi:hypothetical protein
MENNTINNMDIFIQILWLSTINQTIFLLFQINFKLEIINSRLLLQNLRITALSLRKKSSLVRLRTCINKEKKIKFERISEVKYLLK